MSARSSSLLSRLSACFSLKAWQLEPESSSFSPGNTWSNKDMDPVPQHLRKWTTISFCAYWLSDALNIPAYQVASTMLAVGLAWWQVLPAIVVGNLIIGVAITANGTVGARLHVPFPVLNRSSFGFYFSYFSVISRVVLAMFWFAIQTYTGSECVYQMIKAIWPQFATFPNHLPESAHITSAGMLCYFLFWLIQFPFMLVSPQNIRYLFFVKALIAPPAFLAMMIWAFVSTNGATAIFSQGPRITGSSLAWAWLAALNSTLGNFSTLAVNIPDFTRYARSDKDQYIQLVIIPIAFTLTAFIGIAATSASKVLYGEYYWDPLQLIDHWDNRAAAFFMSFAFCLATIGTNVSANSLSAGNDFTALMPRWLNIRRGQILCAFIGGWVICPWEILSSAIGFLNFMGGYTVVLGPIAGIMIADYWLLRKGSIDVPALYHPHGRYRYHGGVNWRACLALLVSVPPNLPGLINSIDPTIDVGGGIYPFSVAWLLGFFLAVATYYTSSLLFPAYETMIESPIFGDEDHDKAVVGEGDKIDDQKLEHVS